MSRVKVYKNNVLRRKVRTRSVIRGTEQSPRLSVFRSNKAIYVQAINDALGVTILSSFGKKKEASSVGENFARKLLSMGIKKGVFDRGSHKYHGVVKSLCEGIRKGGVKV